MVMRMVMVMERGFSSDVKAMDEKRNMIFTIRLMTI